MKKFVLALLVLLGSMVLSGCGVVDFFMWGEDKLGEDAMDVALDDLEKADDIWVEEIGKEEEVEKEEKEEQEADTNDDEVVLDDTDLAEDNIVGFYAATICMVADPSFREWFMDGGNGREDDPNDDENPFLGKYGYSSDAEAEDALRVYVDRESFANKLSDLLGAFCPGRVIPEEFDRILTELRADYGGAPAEEELVDAGECKRDEDCPTICEGTVAWQQGCQGRTNECIKTFDEDCSQVKYKVKFLIDDETYIIDAVCEPEKGCVQGPIPVEERKTELQGQWKILQGKKQDMVSLYEKAAAFCLWTLSDPTGITDLVASAQALDMTSDATKAVMNDVAQAPEATQASIWCSLEQRLKEVDIPTIEAELDSLLERTKKVDFVVDLVKK